MNRKWQKGRSQARWETVRAKGPEVTTDEVSTAMLGTTLRLAVPPDHHHPRKQRPAQAFGATRSEDRLHGMSLLTRTANHLEICLVAVLGCLYQDVYIEDKGPEAPERS